MLISLHAITVLLSVIQQFGLVLGVGAETVLLLMRISGVTRHESDPRERRFVHAIPLVRDTGIALLLISAIAVTVTEYLGHHLDVIFTPAYLAVCALTVLVTLFTIITHGDSFFEAICEGISGATWYALLLMHALAPALAWRTIFDAYGIWVCVWTVCWVGILLLTRRARRNQVSSFARAPTQPPVAVVAASFGNIGSFALQQTQRWPPNALSPMPPGATFSGVTPIVIPKADAASVQAISSSITPMPDPPPPPPPPAMQTIAASNTQESFGLRAVNVMPQNPSEVS